MDDKNIVELYLKRDETAIRHTSDKYGKRLHSLSYDIVKDKETAEECENDTYIKAWTSIPPHEPYQYFYAFLSKIIRRISLNCCRDRKRLKRKAYICELSSEMEQCLPAPDNCQCRIDDLTFSEMINGFLSTLNTEKRNIFICRYWYLDSVADISKNYGMTESKVKTTLFRCRNELKKYLEKEGYIL